MAGLSGGTPPKPLTSRVGALRRVRIRLPPPQLPPETRLVPEMPQEARLAPLLRNSTQLRQHTLHQARLMPLHLRGRAV